jgi:hypothetical protein
VGERVLTMFEASPASFLPRLNRVAETTARGITYSYEPIDDESGYFDMTYATLTDVPTAAFIATAGGLSFLFEMCGVQGTFGEPKWLDSRKRNRMRFLVSWHPRR